MEGAPVFADAAPARIDALRQGNAGWRWVNNKQFNDFFRTGPLTQFFESPTTVWTPRVLKDGAGLGSRWPS
jgi:hypothetical protein